jgi:hypothetical protein
MALSSRKHFTQVCGGSPTVERKEQWIENDSVL